VTTALVQASGLAALQRAGKSAGADKLLVDGLRAGDGASVELYQIRYFLALCETLNFATNGQARRENPGGPVSFDVPAPDLREATMKRIIVRPRPNAVNQSSLQKYNSS
jgi:hypothetical protein